MAKVASQALSVTYYQELKNVMESYKPDIIVFHYPNPFVSEMLLRYKKKDFKLVVYWHLDITKQKMLSKLFYRQNIELLERADRIIATSPNYIDGSWYLSKYKSKCIIIPNCIDENRLLQTPKAKELAEKIRKENEGKTICLSVGRLVPYKGYNYLIKSAKKLGENYTFYIIGDGEQRTALQRQSKNCPSVKFLGKLADDELKAYYIAADIFCFSSITKNEAFGIALAEAMYFGLPAVTYTIPGSGVNYVSLNGETGLEVPNRDTVAFAKAIQELSNPDKKSDFGKKAYLRIMEKFLFSQFKSNLITVMAE